ncbi:MAG: hypothetical protein QM726_25575 [Chitinophagaceae bacterium]
MKKVLFVSAALLMAVIGTQAQTDLAKNDSKSEKKEIRKEKKESRITLKKLEGPQVSYQSKQEFIRDFDNPTNVSWRRTSYFDEASFTSKEGLATTAYFDIDGQLVGTTSLKTFADIPADAQKRINKEYKDYTVKSVVFFDDNEANETDMILYNSQFDDEDNYFVALQKDDKTIVVQVTMDGNIGFFTEVH